MGEKSLMLKDTEIVEIPVIREGNLEDATFVAWRTVDKEAINGVHFIGGEGKQFSWATQLIALKLEIHLIENFTHDVVIIN